MKRSERKLMNRIAKIGDLKEEIEGFLWKTNYDLWKILDDNDLYVPNIYEYRVDFNSMVVYFVDVGSGDVVTNKYGERFEIDILGMLMKKYGG